MSLTLSGIVIESRESDKFINATQLCQAGGKVFSKWYRLEGTKKLIKELANNLNAENADDQIWSSANLVDIIQGGNDKHNQGTWIHPDLAVQLAQWISPSFAIQVSRWIRELFATGSVSIGSIKTDEEVKRLEAELKESRALIEEKAMMLEEEKAINERLKRREIALTSFVENIKRLEKNQIFYLATSPFCARQNRFKIGGVESKDGLKKRLHSYNSGRPEGDLFYYTKIIYCNDYKTIENRIKSLLAKFLDKPNSKKEMMHMRYDCLETAVEFICENYDREIEFLNQWCEDFFNKTIDEEPIIPEPLDIQALFAPQIEAVPTIQAALEDHIEVAVQRAGRRQRVQKIDISGWTEEQIQQKVTEIVQLCARKQVPTYDFATQKNIVAIQLSWSVIREFMLAYKGFTMTQWREVFKTWHAAQKPKKLQIKGIKCV